MTDDSRPDDTFEAPGTQEPEPAADAGVETAEPATAEIPTEPVATTTATGTPTAETPTATASRPVAPTARRGGVFVPVWLAVTVAGLLLLGAGFGVGYAVGNDNGHEGRAALAPGAFGSDGRAAPFGPFGQYPDDRSGQGNRNGQGNRRTPNRGDNGNRSEVFLGVAIRDSSNPTGAEVIRVVARGPAAASGIKAGDVITKIDDTVVKDAAALTAAVHQHQAGDKITVAYSRDGSTGRTTVTLSDRSPLVQQ